MTQNARCLYGLTILWAMTAWSCSGLSTQESEDNAYVFEPASCGATFDGPALKSHVTEADEDYLARLEALEIGSLPETYNLSSLYEMDLSLIAYMLDLSQVETLKRDDLAALGDIGRAVLLALGRSATPTQVDLRELRRGLYHFYYCYRGLPADLDSFKALFGDYTLWPWFMLEDSYPKIYPRRIRRNPELGIYIAETIRDGVVHETEVIMQGYRDDGMLEFLAYMPNGNISSRGEFRAGAEFSVGTSPYTCMACHYNSEQLTYDVVFPLMSRD